MTAFAWESWDGTAWTPVHGLFAGRRRGRDRRRGPGHDGHAAT